VEIEVSQQEIVSLYERFCQLDRSAKGFVSEDEFLSIPEFSTNPLSQVRLPYLSGSHLPILLLFVAGSISGEPSLCFSLLCCPPLHGN
jgi:hypothetical protein